MNDEGARQSPSDTEPFASSLSVVSAEGNGRAGCPRCGHDVLLLAGILVCSVCWAPTPATHWTCPCGADVSLMVPWCPFCRRAYKAEDRRNADHEAELGA